MTTSKKVDNDSTLKMHTRRLVATGVLRRITMNELRNELKSYQRYKQSKGRFGIFNINYSAEWQFSWTCTVELEFCPHSE